MTISVSTISTVKEFLALKKKWNELNNTSPKGNFFTSWEWLYQWWETYQSSGIRKLCIIILTDSLSQNLVAIAPFQFVYNPKKFPCSKQLMLLGTGEVDDVPVFSENMDIISSKYFNQEALQLISKYLYQNKHQWQSALFPQLLEDSNLSMLFSSYQKSIIKNSREYGFRTIINLPHDYDTYLMNRSSKTRRNIRSAWRKLEGEKYVIKSINSNNEIDKALDILIQLSKSRRDNKGDKSSFEDKKFILFHRKLLHRLLPDNGISFKILYIDDIPVAVNYLFFHKNMISGYQCGFEETLGKRYSLMTLLIMHEVEKSIENPNLEKFNFMFSENNTVYKTKYADQIDKMINLSFYPVGFRSSFYQLIHGPMKQAVKFIVLKKPKLQLKVPYFTKR